MVSDILLSLIFPHHCAVCDAVLPITRQDCCDKCRNKIVYVSKNCCARCGRTVDHSEEYCMECQNRKHYFDSGRFTFPYEFISESVYRFKYCKRSEYAGFYSEHIVRLWGNEILEMKADAIIPIPLHKKRLAYRGYNQSEELAKELSKRLGIPCYTRLAFRVKNTIPQKECDRKQRQNNLKKAFIVCENVVKLSTIILVDDIYTTGSTIDSLAVEFRRIGVKKIYFLTITSGMTQM